MDLKLFIVFIILNVFNVIMHTVKSIATIKCNKLVASIINALTYGLYTVVVIYMVCDLPLVVKIITVAITNLIGVYIVKSFEEKYQKQKLWKIEVIVDEGSFVNFKDNLTLLNIESVSFISGGKKQIVACYCYTKEDTKKVLSLAKMFKLKSTGYENILK